MKCEYCHVRMTKASMIDNLEVFKDMGTYNENDIQVCDRCGKWIDQQDIDAFEAGEIWIDWSGDIGHTTLCKECTEGLAKYLNGGIDG